jgi:transposase InsO family protein
MELCQVAGVSRAGYYRFQPRVQASEADMDLRSAIQQIALEWPSYGYRRVHRELMRRGWKVNHKRVLRRMRVDNLLCLRKRKFILTTDSHHGLRIYPNLAKDMVLTGINQLWIADITYIRLEVEFVYLAVLLDAFSRSCIGWALQGYPEAAAIQYTGQVLRASVNAGGDSVQMIAKRSFVKRLGTTTFMNRRGDSPTSLRAQNAHEVYRSCAPRGQQ